MMNAIRSILLLFSLACFGSAHALTLKPVKVAPDVYAFIGETGARTYENYGMNANTGFIVTGEGVVVIDSGSTYLSARAMHQAIRKITAQPVKYVINTGGQDHRWLGNGYFRERGAEIIASRRTRADMEERAEMQMNGLRRELRKHLAGTKPEFPDHLFDTEETLRLGATEIRLLYFQGGHTPGDSVVWLPSSGVLFSGDLIFVDRLLGVLPMSNTRAWLASFEEIEKLGPSIIVPGHGRICGLDQARRETRDYLRLLRDHMKKAVAEVADIQTAIDTLDQSAFSYLKNYDALKGGNASRTYQEMTEE